MIRKTLGFRSKLGISGGNRKEIRGTNVVSPDPRKSQTREMVKNTPGRQMTASLRNGSWVLLLALALCVGSSEHVLAQTSWRGTTSTAWSNSANWTSGVPTSSVDAILGDANFTGANQPTVDATANCRSLTLGSGTVASTLTIGNSNLTVAQGITIGTNGTFTHSGNGTITLSGNFVNNNTGLDEPATAAFTFSGTGNQTITSASTSGKATFGNLTINKSAGTVTLNSDVQVKGNVAITSGTLDVDTYAFSRTSSGGSITLSNGGTLRLGGTNGFPTSFTTRTVNFGSMAEYYGTTQTVLNLAYSNLTISGSSTKTLAGATAVYSTLTLSAGTLVTGSYTLTLGLNTTFLGTLTRTSGIIVGNFKRWFSAATVSNVLFPVGTLVSYLPVNLSFTAAPSAGGTLTASFVASDPGQTGLPLNDAGASIIRCAPDGYWTLTAADGLTGGTYSLDLTATGFGGVSDYTSLRILKRATAGSWTLNGTHAAGTGSNSVPVVHRTGMSGFSEFGIGGSSANPLPIQLVSFTARTVGGEGVVLRWSTLTETDNYGFYLERKGEKEYAYALLPGSFVGGNGTTNAAHLYSYVDSTVMGGSWSYRLRQVDLDGTVHYSDPVFVGVGNTSGQVAGLQQNFPNPFNPRTVIRYQLSAVSDVRLVVYDLLGREVAVLVDRVMDAGTHEASFDGSGLPSGIYVYRLKAGSFSESRKLTLIR
jgi:hypothetical protein